MSDNGYKRNGPRPRGTGAALTAKEKKQRTPLQKFLIVFLSIIGVFIIVTAIVVIVYSLAVSNSDLTDKEKKAQLAVASKLGMESNTSADAFTNLFETLPHRTNFLLMGIDWDGMTNRSDTIMVGSFDSDKGELSFISVPRDTMITISERTRKEIDELDVAHLPSHSRKNGKPNIGNSMKINAIYHHFGQVYGPVFLQNQLEEIMGISIDYRAEVNLSGFEFIVDEIGGVWFDVPQRMYYIMPRDEYGVEYNIDIKPGHQLLNGKKALEVLRYRKSSDENIAPSYSAADLKRVTVQQAFLREAITQALKLDKIINNPGAYFELVSKYITTNLDLSTALKYINIAKELKAEDIKTYTIPIDEALAHTNVYVDALRTRELVQKVFYGIDPDAEQEADDVLEQDLEEEEADSEPEQE